MATYIQRLKRKNSSGSYDTIHLETSAKAVLMDNGSSLSESGGGKVLYPIKDLVSGTIQSGNTVTIGGEQWIVIGTNPLKGLAYFMANKTAPDTSCAAYAMTIEPKLANIESTLPAKVLTALVPEVIDGIDYSQPISYSWTNPGRLKVLRTIRLPTVSDIIRLNKAQRICSENNYWLEDVVLVTNTAGSDGANPSLNRFMVDTTGEVKINTGYASIRPVIALQIA